MKTPTSSDPFWDELGIEWTAIQPDNAVVAPRLEARIHRQSMLINRGLIVGLLAALTSALVSAFCIWIGWHTGEWNFVIRGIAFAVIAGILSLGITALLRVRSGGGPQSLSEMLGLSISRLRKALWLTRLGFAACGITALLGVAGTMVRTHLSRPPAMSPLVDLALLAVLALGLFLYGRRAQSDLRKYTQLRHILVGRTEEK